MLTRRQQKKIKEFEPIIKNVVKEETEDAAMAQADMQVRKAQNMIDHEDEIFSRAPRQWIMDETRRKDAKGLQSINQSISQSTMVLMTLCFCRFAELSKLAHQGEATKAGALPLKVIEKARPKRKREDDVDRTSAITDWWIVALTHAHTWLCALQRRWRRRFALPSGIGSPRKCTLSSLTVRRPAFYNLKGR
jgi:hypothetical protein